MQLLRSRSQILFKIIVLKNFTNFKISQENTLAVIKVALGVIYETMSRNSEIPFLSGIEFNNAFSHEKRITILFKMKHLKKKEEKKKNE